MQSNDRKISYSGATPQDMDSASFPNLDPLFPYPTNPLGEGSHRPALSRVGLYSPTRYEAAEGHKNRLDCNRLVARNRYLSPCRSAVSMAKSRSSTCPIFSLCAAWTDRLGFKLENNYNEKAATHILLVADPHILDERSYPERSSPLRAVSRIFVDMNLRKAWRVARGKRPHAIIFLGDMMDNGFADMHITKCVYLPPSSHSNNSSSFLQA